jgi:tRNA-specific 2-thiouridylase
VLAVCTPEQLAGALFPLGGSHKDQVRAEAARRGLAVADKPDSHDICFIADGDTQAWLRDRIGAAPGDVVDADGAVVGRHEGAYAYTVGQRRGLRLGRPAPDGKPRYVLDVEPVTNTVRVGPAQLLDVVEVVGERPVWPSGPRALDGSALLAQLRAHGEPTPARAHLDGDRLVVRLAVPARGVARGQAVVLYDGTRVVASATISHTGAAVSEPA